MIQTPECPVCDAVAWREIGRRTFSRAEGAAAKDRHRTHFRVLFEVWAPGAEDFTVTYQLCRHCGFVLYTPRPSADEVRAKYQFSSGTADHRPPPPYTAARERLRARRVFGLLSPHLADAGDSRLLDYGGGDGRLLQDFIRAGCECHVADYNRRPIPGIRRIGATVRDLDSARAYDAVVCSHVLEHVVNPLSILKTLATALKKGGAIYVEVPVEIWRRPPAPSEPVTHINFFTPLSLRYLVARAGLAIEYCRLTSYPHPQGGWRMAASCIARNSAGQVQDLPKGGVEEVERLLRPSVAFRIQRRMMLARDVPTAALRKARRWMGGERAA